MPLQPDRQTSDLELVKEIAQRNSQAFADFYDRHAPTAFALLCRLLGDRHEAEEALQDTFWQVWRQAGLYDSARGHPVAWLVQIARSRGLDRLRQIRLRDRRDAGPFEDLSERLPMEKTPEDTVMVQETQKVVRRALDGLPSEQREAVMLAFLNGLTHPEIAKQLGAPLGTIKTRIRLGMRKLQEVLQEAKGT